MSPASSNALVGERWPAPDIQKSARNRNNHSVALAGSCKFEPERVENMQPDKHMADTRNRIIVRGAFTQGETR